MATLVAFHEKRKTMWGRTPFCGGKELDLFVLYSSVVERGGYDRVVQDKLWVEVIRNLKLPSSATSAAFALRHHYWHLLYAFEQKTLHNIDVPVHETPAPAVQIKRERMKTKSDGGGRKIKRSKTHGSVKSSRKHSEWDSDEDTDSDIERISVKQVDELERYDASTAAAQADADASVGPDDMQTGPSQVASERGGELRPRQRKNYNESLPMQDEMEDLVQAQQQQEEEARAARFCGLPAVDVTVQELRAMPDLTTPENRAKFLSLRNHILKMWKRRITYYLPQQRVVDKLSREYTASVVTRVYSFLNYAGYINCGVLRNAIPVKPIGKRVLVIGAGMAGLCAARQLQGFGFDVLVIEGRDRVGGRVCSDWRCGAGVDLGAAFITGIEGNPIAMLCDQLGVDMHRLNSKCNLYDFDGKLFSELLDKQVEADFNKLLDMTKQHLTPNVDTGLGVELRRLQQEHGICTNDDAARLLQWHVANLEYANGVSLDKLSVTEWDQDDGYQMNGAHCMVRQGYGRVPQGLASGLHIRLGAKVVSVNMNATGGGHVALESGETIRGDAILCTLPLGVLKANVVQFNPPLPDWKTDVIQRLGFGVLNKVCVQFSSMFWDGSADVFGYVNSDAKSRGKYYIFWNLKRVCGLDALLALVAGDSAEEIETMDSNEVVKGVLNVLSQLYGNIPPPTKALITRWRADPWARGSYSYVSVGATGDDYDTMARPIGERLFFAGEATIKQFPATVHGAFLSGLREAERIAYVLLGQRNADYPPSLPAEIRPDSEVLADVGISAD
eukprot:TRINITY_DN5693_c0_g1_i2.p1 TRINITY_DN5693_c0_g1~~TRINITY_DN5693_c0_g1_i2.p1  ORF type:complete len:851 (+),score=182.56 TRINITY_DN5693_c0_g1_i2:197-2554(+)